MSRTDPSTIDGYLDALFDRLAGTGAAGRRALSEAEDHLRTATAEAMDRGATAAAAEREATAQFGDVATFALALRRTYRPGPLAAVVSNVWLLAGLALAMTALAFLLTAVDRWMSSIHQPGTAGLCLDDPAQACTPAAEIPRMLVIAAVAALAATALLVARALTRRRAGLTGSSRLLPVLSAVVCAAAAPLLFFGPAPDPTTLNDSIVAGGSGPGIYFTVYAAGTIAAAALAAVVWAVVRYRRAAIH